MRIIYALNLPNMLVNFIISTDPLRSLRKKKDLKRGLFMRIEDRNGIEFGALGEFRYVNGQNKDQFF